MFVGTCGWEGEAIEKNARLQIHEEALPVGMSVRCVDVTKLRMQELQIVDYAHASPDCKSNSNLAINTHQRREENDYRGVTAGANEFDRVVSARPLS